MKARVGWREKHEIVTAKKTMEEMSDEELLEVLQFTREAMAEQKEAEAEAARQRGAIEHDPDVGGSDRHEP